MSSSARDSTTPTSRCRKPCGSPGRPASSSASRRSTSSTTPISASRGASSAARTSAASPTRGSPAAIPARRGRSSSRCGRRSEVGCEMRLRLRLTAVLTAFAVLSAVAPTAWSQPQRAMGVLVLHYYGPDMPMRTPFDPAFTRVITEAPSRPFELFSEALETYRFTDPDHESRFVAYLRGKYAGRVDVIVAVADPAVAFLERHRDDLFPHVPVLAYVTAGPPPPGTTSASGGIWGGARISENFELLLALHPAVRRVVVVDGAVANSGILEKEIRLRFTALGSRAS